MNGAPKPQRSDLTILAFGVASITVLWLAFAGFLAITRNNLLTAAERTSAAAAIALDQHVTWVVAAANSALATAADQVSRAIQDGMDDPAAIETMLARIVATHPGVSALFVTDQSGRVTHYAPGSVGVGIDVSDRDYFLAQRGASQPDLVVGAPVAGRVTGATMTPFSRALSDNTGGFAGIVVATVRLKALEDFLRSIQTTPESVVGIVRPDGIIVARQPPEFIGQSLAENPLFTEHLPRAPVATIRLSSRLDPRDRIVTYRALPTMPLYVYTAISVDDALADWYQDVRIMTALAAFVSAVIGAFALLLLRGERRRAAAELDYRRSEAQLVEARRMEAVGRLAGGIAHDFNNVLAAIRGFADFLVEDLGPETDQHTFAQRIVTASQRGKELVQQVLAFSRLDRVERVPTDLVEVVREAASLVVVTLPAETRLDVTASDAPLVAEVNAGQLSRVLLNLIANAKDALTGQPGVITISVSFLPPGSSETELFTRDKLATNGRVTVGSLDPTRAYARIGVSDTGAGMTDEQLQRMFEPFFTTKAVGQGTGLGLAVVHGTMMSYGGACRVESRLALGTDFILYLPLVHLPLVDATGTTDPPSTDTASADAPTAARSAQVLVVDDDVMMTETLAIALGRRGFHVETVTGPREALARLRADPARYDIVVSDVAMPEMSGTDLCVAAREVAPALPFVLCSGYADAKEEAKTLACGADALLMKPVAIETLTELIIRLTRAATPGALVS